MKMSCIYLTEVPEGEKKQMETIFKLLLERKGPRTGETEYFQSNPRYGREKLQTGHFNVMNVHM